MTELELTGKLTLDPFWSSKVINIFLICLNLYFISSVFRKDKFIFETVQILKRIRIQTILGALLLIPSVVMLCYGIVTFLPFTNWSWLQLIKMDSSNIAIGPAVEMAGIGPLGKTLAISYFILLAVAMPIFAKSEENSFRKGNEDNFTYVVSSIKFGLVHCIVGVPLYAGIGLIWPGLVFGWVYRQSMCKYYPRLSLEKSQELSIVNSTALHATYNLIVVVVLLVVICFGV